MLTPVLEREVARRHGAVDLVKLDVDANPALASSYGIQGIPAVKAFRDGRVVAEFVGAQPATAVSRFLDGLVPSKAEVLAANGDEASLRQALELEPDRADAALTLAKILHRRGEADEALDILGRVHGSFAAGGLGSGELFVPALSQLAEHHQVVVPDLQGHGRTADIDRPIDVRLMADDIAALIDHLGLDKPDVVGYSLGGGVALHTAAKYPDKVRRLVLISANVTRDAIPPEMLAQQLQVGDAALPGELAKLPLGIVTLRV